MGRLPITFRILMLAGAAILQVIYWKVSAPGSLFEDFYSAYYPAAEQLWMKGARSGWPLHPEFVNIPLIGYLFLPFVLIGKPTAGWMFLLAGIMAIIASGVLLIRSGGFERVPIAALVALGLANGPLVYSLKEGNATHLVLLAMTAALFLWKGGRELMAGTLLAVCGLIKPPLMLFGIYLVFRRKWTMVAAGAITVVVVFGVSIALHGFDTHIGWYTSSIEPFLGQVIPAHNVQSLDAFMMRLYTGSERLHHWQPMIPEPWHAVVRVPIAAAGLLALAWFSRPPESPPGQRGQASPAHSAAPADEFSFVLVLALLLSPLSWSHYYLLLLIPFFLYLSGQLTMPNDRISSILMGGAIALTSLPVILPEIGRDHVSEIFARTTASAWMFGALLLLAALCRGRATRKLRQSCAPATAPARTRPPHS